MSLSKHNVRHLYWANLWGGSNFLEPVITFFYTLHGLNPTQILFVFLSFSVSILVFEVPTGAFADRFGAKISFIMGCPVAHLFKSDFIRTCRFPGRMKRCYMNRSSGDIVRRIWETSWVKFKPPVCSH
jgi:hypothetical protein